MRNFGDGELACDLGAVCSLACPIQLDLAVVDSNQPDVSDAHENWSRALSMQADVLGLALTEFNISVYFRNFRDGDFSPIALHRNGRELAFKPGFRPGSDVLVLPVPVGGRSRHARWDRGHFVSKQ